MLGGGCSSSLDPPPLDAPPPEPLPPDAPSPDPPPAGALEPVEPPPVAGQADSARGPPPPTPPAVTVPDAGGRSRRATSAGCPSGRVAGSALRPGTRSV